VTVEVHLDVHPKGYRLLRVETAESRHYLAEHRLVAYATGSLDSPFFETDAREVHHIDGLPERSDPSNLEALTSEDHGQTTQVAARDPNEAKQTEGVTFEVCSECDEGRPHHVLTDGTHRCVVCGHPTAPAAADAGETSVEARAETGRGDAPIDATAGSPRLVADGGRP